MKTLFILYTLIFLPQISGSQDADQNKYIRWNEFLSLHWKDFLGRPNAESVGDAATSVIIKAKPYIVKKHIHYQIYAFFDKTKSWYRHQTPELLAHEQLHFDIAELYARKARKKIAELSQRGEKDLKKYNTAVQKILNESNSIDQQYDAETLHGSMIGKQDKWKKRIHEELTQLDKYRD